MTKPRAIFLPLVGQHENIGDIILRRPLAEWLAPHGVLHVYVGSAACDGYVNGLGLGSTAVVYRGLGDWLKAWAKAAVAGNAAYFFKPGEIQLTLVGMKEHLGMLPWILLTRLRGGRVVRIGAGARNFAALPRLLMWPSLQLPQLTLWRDPETAAYMGVGGVMPDLAFSELQGAPAEDADRKFMIVSMRGDRAYPPKNWIEGVKAAAASRGLSVLTVTQVLRDSDYARRLAVDLGGEVVDWDGTQHDLMEAKLRALYRQSVVAVSDRLHVLIAAYTEGAVPVALLTDGSGKIGRHFSVLGVERLAKNSPGVEADALKSFISNCIDERDTLRNALGSARERLAAVRAQVDRLFSGTRA
jgi:polysaccharide pyruvyl transferase WcaK-like protein